MTIVGISVGASLLRSVGFVLPFYAIGSALGVLGFLILRNRSGVPRPWAVVFLVPLFVWLLVGEFAGNNGSLSNAAFEPLALGASMTVIEGVRLALPAKGESVGKKRFGVAMSLGVLLAAGFAMWFPVLAE